MSTYRETEGRSGSRPWREGGEEKTVEGFVLERDRGRRERIFGP